VTNATTGEGEKTRLYVKGEKDCSSSPPERSVDGGKLPKNGRGGKAAKT